MILFDGIVFTTHNYYTKLFMQKLHYTEIQQFAKNEFLKTFEYQGNKKTLVQYSLHLSRISVRILVSDFADIVTFTAFGAKVFSYGQKI